MSKTSISKDDYLRLIGLLTISTDYNKLLRSIEKSVARILGVEAEDYDPPYYGHASDAVYSDYTADELLSRLEIQVADDEGTR